MPGVYLKDQELLSLSVFLAHSVPRMLTGPTQVPTTYCPPVHQYEHEQNCGFSIPVLLTFVCSWLHSLTIVPHSLISTLAASFSQWLLWIGYINITNSTCPSLYPVLKLLELFCSLFPLNSFFNQIHRYIYGPKWCVIWELTIGLWESRLLYNCLDYPFPTPLIYPILLCLFLLYVSLSTSKCSSSPLLFNSKPLSSFT